MKKSQGSHKSITRIFIANRGEIARRIAATARRMGIETVAICEQRPPAYLVGVVSKFVRVPEENTQLYLNSEKMIELAKASGCDAVHPGFGFLSENAGFAAAVAKSGLTWIGPKPSAIDAMASKARARELAIQSKVPCIEGIEDLKIPADEHGDFTALTAFAKKTGYPLIIKAAMGGGGKGMRLVENDADLVPNALRAASEALSSFGDAALIVERYLPTPRHVEVQILADQHGHVYAIGDRDCSVQRRHQKVLEEAPAPGLSEITRKAMHSAAISLAQKVGYDSTGTVEFLVDWTAQSIGASQQSFFFLEMNTRLQVEHPVTEEVFGIDLVEWQIRVAGGEPLPDSFGAIKPRGHSIEARFYAEDCPGNFFPSPGPVRAFVPATGPRVRWEVGLDAVDTITTKFDPMVAKAITFGASREDAISLLAKTLEDTFFAGPPSNREYLAVILRRTPFAKGPVSTKFLKDEHDRILTDVAVWQQSVQATAAPLIEAVLSGSLSGHQLKGGDVGIEAVTQIAFKGGPRDTSEKSPTWNTIHTEAHHVGAQFNIIGEAIHSDTGETFRYCIANTPEGREAYVSVQGITVKGEERRNHWAGESTADQSHTSEVTAPVPGKVVAVKVKSGDSAQPGQVLFVLESMKMEFEVKASRDGIIETISTKQGEQVTAGRVLASWQS